MILAASILGLGLAFAAFAVQASQYRGPIRVPFALKANLIVMDAKVNDQPARLVFDTGASQTVIDAGTADRFGLASVERRWARGAGGDIEVSLAALRSLAIGAATAMELTCIVSDLSGISEKLGGGIDGVLGFDFNSRFRITIDYAERALTLEPGSAICDEEGRISGNSWTRRDLGFEVRRPDATWDFAAKTALPQIVLELKKRGSDACVSIHSQELHGLSLAQLLGDLRESLPQQFAEIREISSRPTLLAGHPAHRFEVGGRRDGAAILALVVASVINDRVWTITCIAGERRFGEYKTEFETMLDSVCVKVPPGGRPGHLSGAAALQ